ncbi:TRAP transporter 4TM/12TM fusion protein [Constrictibacter sp. MBR-5]|jgi:TRAP transporter 4TM/12TM fusion protein|uniref:TRAP transporter permease n=1 Tax=Constrictibacter sp. MBR-5 TaxID=3156467 RepID=UPI003396DD65
MLVKEELERAEAEEIARYRKLKGFWGTVFAVFTGIAVVLGINQMFNLGFGIGLVLIEPRYFYLLTALLLPLVFVAFPATKSGSKEFVPWYDALLALITFVVLLYFVWEANRILEEAWEYSAPNIAIALSCLLWLLLIEIGRRTGGPSILVVTIVFSLFPVYAHLVPEVISGVNQSIWDTAAFHIMSVESFLGIPMRAFGTLVFGFLIFGVAMQYTGAGAFFINFAFALLGKVRGGPAKVAIFSSGLFGSMSGSVVSNVLTTGCMTIPAMKKIGFKPAYAGGVEACASTGGVLMPPIMGATAFVMASFLNVPYVEVVIAATIPSLLYYFGLFMQIDAYAARRGMKGLPASELPSLWQTVKEGWYYIFAFLALIYMLLILQQEATAPFYATALLLGINQISAKHRMNWAKFKAFFFGTGILFAELCGILAAIGLIVGSLSLTGMAGTLTNDLVFIAGGNVLMLLVMGALTSFILGMGMTVTACYIFLAVILAPALIKAGLNPMGVHLFLMYWGMISFITPPVAIGAFVAAGLAKAPPMQTGMEAMRLGIVIYIVPFFFVFNPALLFQGEATEIAIVVGTAILGVIVISGALQGYLLQVGDLGSGPVSLFARLLIFAGGLFLAAPGGTFGLGHLELLALSAAAILPGLLLVLLTRRFRGTGPIGLNPT